MAASTENGGTQKVWVPFALVGALVLVASGLTLAGVSAVVIVLAIAAAQAAIVVGWMMHLSAAGRAVTWTAGLAAFLLVALFALTYVAYQDTIEGQEQVGTAAEPGEAAGEEH